MKTLLIAMCYDAHELLFEHYTHGLVMVKWGNNSEHTCWQLAKCTFIL